MKKLNKKGFTLIELLAVIIILGVLMIIAIPSVTEYITSSRKSAYVDTAAGYIDAVRTKVNQAEKLQFFDINTLYLVPVGHDTERACVSVEKGGASPFSDEWKYAYVGVTYNGTGYNYYFIAKDGSNQGINFVSQRDLAELGGDLVASGSNQLAEYTALTTTYAADDDAEFAIACAEGATGCTELTQPSTFSTDFNDTDTNYTLGTLEKVVQDEEGSDKSITNVVVVGVGDCAY